MQTQTTTQVLLKSSMMIMKGTNSLHARTASKNTNISFTLSVFENPFQK